ncbi:MAG TPA: 16S rRNA (cytidine(1402)-2'-O)-methyltransferase [Pantanalinema sp.]
MTPTDNVTTGTLYVCGTPIGNLSDVSVRMLDTLRDADVIAAEDTRQVAKLLTRFAITTQTLSYHEHNEAGQAPRLVARLKAGQNVALVSDAGMPGISDPGEAVIQAAIREGIPVVPIPGPVAAVAGLVVSGLPTARWVFEGFLPREGKQRRRMLRTLVAEPRTLVFYEGPHRLLDTLTDMAEAFGPARPVAVARELTKAFEEVVRGTLESAIAHFSAHAPRGEITLVVGGCPDEEQPHAAPDMDSRLLALLGQGMSKQDASKQIAKELGVPKRDAYQRALSLSANDPSEEQ